MTINEFLEAFEARVRETQQRWTVDMSVGMGRLRTEGALCPMEWMCGSDWHSIDRLASQLGLTVEDAEQIAYAADDHPYQYHQLRARLLRITGKITGAGSASSS